MALPLLPIALGVVGLGALVLPALGKKDYYPPGPAPGPTPDLGYQGIPMKDLTKPARVPLKNGKRYFTDLRSVEVWDGTTPLEVWGNKVAPLVEGYIAANGLTWESTYWTNRAAMRAGDPMRLNIEFTNPGATGTMTFAAPSQTGVFVDSLAEG